MLEYEYIEKNLTRIREKINKAAINRDNRYTGNTDHNVRLLAVTKTVGVEKINFAISKGVNLIGENKVSELLEKYDRLNKDGLEIHFIGNLQTNKVKYIIDKVSMIQSVNSLRLAEEINKRAALKNIKMDILAEVNIGGEISKIGVKPEEALEFIKAIGEFGNIKVKGLMTIPPFFDFEREDPEKIKTKKFFEKMHKIFLDISSKKSDNIDMRILSMGMSDDYEEAIARGSNLVRLGRSIFGER